MSVDQVHVCPFCRHRMVVLSERCPECEGDLSALLALVDAADRRFNEGLRLAARKHNKHAAEEFSAALALNPLDTEAEEMLELVRGRRARRV